MSGTIKWGQISINFDRLNGVRSQLILIAYIYRIPVDKLIVL